MRCVWILLVMTACGGDGDGGGLFGGDPELEGTWKEACEGRGTSEIEVVGNRIEYTHRYFTMDRCLGTVFIIRTDVEEYVVGRQSLSSPDATEVDYTAKSVTFTVTEQATADSYNQSAYCGITDWALNVPKDIMGKTCGNRDGTSTTFWNAGDVFYDIYKVEDAKLYFGDNMTGNGETAATRPTKLLTTYYSK